MEKIKVYKDDRMNQLYPYRLLATDGTDIAGLFTPLFRVDEETHETELLDVCFDLGEDAKTVILIWNKGVYDIYAQESDLCRIKAGGGIQGAEDMVMKIRKGGVATITPESGRFKQVRGSDKGKVVLSPESGEFYVAVFEAP